MGDDILSQIIIFKDSIHNHVKVDRLQVSGLGVKTEKFCNVAKTPS